MTMISFNNQLEIENIEYGIKLFSSKAKLGYMYIYDCICIRKDDLKVI